MTSLSVASYSRLVPAAMRRQHYQSAAKSDHFARTDAKHITHSLHKGGVYFAPRVQQWFDHSYRAFRALEPGEGFEPPPDLASLPS